MNIVKKNFNAYVQLRKKFMTYIEGTSPLPNGAGKNSLFFDYLKVRVRNPEKRVSMSEYMIFGFHKLPLAKQKEYLTDYEATILMRPHNNESMPYLKDKVCFLKTFSPLINRDWLYLPDSNLQEFKAFLAKHPVIALKPPLSSWGIGFRAICGHQRPLVRW